MTEKWVKEEKNTDKRRTGCKEKCTQDTIYNERWCI